MTESTGDGGNCIRDLQIPCLTKVPGSLNPEPVALVLLRDEGTLFAAGVSRKLATSFPSGRKVASRVGCALCKFSTLNSKTKTSTE